MLCRKPFFLKWFTGPDRWMTVWPFIFAGDAYWGDRTNPFWVPIRAHEEMHYKRQLQGFWIIWFMRYLLSKRFKLQEESAGIAEELRLLDGPSQYQRFKDYCNELSGQDYKRCAASPEEAGAAIRQACENASVTLLF